MQNISKKGALIIKGLPGNLVGIYSKSYGRFIMVA